VSPKPVFFDPGGRRGVWASRLAAGLIGLVAVLAAILIVSAMVAPTLPALPLRAVRAAFHPGATPKAPREPALRKLPAPSPGSAGALRYGFFVNWDDNAFVSLERNAGKLDVLVPEWLHLAGPDGSIRPDDPARQLRTRAWLKANAPAVRITPLVNNFDSRTQAWDAKGAAAMLADANARRRFEDGLLAYVGRTGDAGLHLDLEDIAPASQPAFLTLVRELSARLHAQGRVLDVSMPVDAEGADWRGLAGAADHITLMAYDENSSEGDPGPVASQGWFEAALSRRLADLDASKFVVALGSYGYDWTGPGKGHEVTVQEAWQAAVDSEADVAFDPKALNPAFGYREDDGSSHQVWFLDAASGFNQARAALDQGVGGLALWRMGSEDPGVWSWFARGRTPDAVAAADMRRLQAGYDIVYQGEGEALRVTGKPQAGSRTFDYDAAEGLITDEAVTAFPRALTLTRWGRRTDTVAALTFDDGPSPVWTPKILDILKAQGVPATFFVIGSAGEDQPGLMKRIVAEGHDLGSHTYTHPNIGQIPTAQARMELNATERLFEAVLGVRPVLFRPPYAEDVEPSTVDDARVLGLATQLGYTSVGLHVDSNDWRKPGVAAIVDNTVRGIERGDGSVVLMHDSGGDRAQTVAALPIVIRRLKADGYRFVTLHDLLGLQRADVMPRVPAEQRLQAGLEQLAFGAVRGFNGFVAACFVVGLVMGAARFLFVFILALIQARRDRRRRSLGGPLPSLAVIVPAYNEQTVVAATVRSVLAAAPPGLEDFEVVVVDDGSSDDTAGVVRREFAGDPRVRLIVKANGGKASALAAGIAATRAEVVVVIDADTVLAPEALGLLARRFGDPAVGAVAGNARVGNRVTLMTRFQALEYLTSQNLDRRAFEVLNAIPVVPGAIGGWRRTALLAAGGFDGDTLAEDADATLKIQRLGWRVLYEPAAIAWTEAPEGVRPFMKQRFRWMFGTLQAAFKHHAGEKAPQARRLDLMVRTNVVLFQIVFPLISPAMDLLLVASVLSAAFAAVMHPAEAAPSGAVLAIAFYLVFQLIELAGAAMAFVLEGDEDWRLLGLVLLQRFCYRQLLYVTAVRAVMAAVKGQAVGWNKLERTARPMGGASIALSGATSAGGDVQDHPQARPGVLQHHLAAVQLGAGGDDGQAQAGARRAPALVQPDEALQDA
jgi:cellulose synthase/poly-beta-1,6-N-acetylglucosamine synthase-like glycosyltransferase/peptidoglycan/xylan/chitin deacetylase (PgdA/CDA1 family)/spore germination protein YaaH